jgi:hypothetical protein
MSKVITSPAINDDCAKAPYAYTYAYKVTVDTNVAAPLGTVGLIIPNPDRVDSQKIAEEGRVAYRHRPTMH